MRYRELGRTGLEISEIGFGAEWMEKKSAAEVRAVVERCDAQGNAVLSLRNKFAVGNTVELVGPDLRPFLWQVPPMEDSDGVPLLEPRTPQMRFRARLPKQVPPLSFVRHAVALSGI